MHFKKTWKKLEHMKFLEKNYARFFNHCIISSNIYHLPSLKCFGLVSLGITGSIVYSSTPRMEAEVCPDCGDLVTKLHIIGKQYARLYHLNTTILSDIHKYLNYMFRPLWPLSGCVTISDEKLYNKMWYISNISVVTSVNTSPSPPAPLLAADTTPHTSRLHPQPQWHLQLKRRTYKRHRWNMVLYSSTSPPYLCKRDLVPHLHHTNICNVPHFII